MTSNAYDAMIVGARPAGAATALLLARAGARVLMVDWAELGADTVSTFALMRSAVMQLSDWGLIDRLKEAGTPAIRRTTFHYGPESLAVDIRPEGGVDVLYAARRTVLDPILSRAAAEAGAEVRYRTAFRDLIRGEDGRVRGAVLTGPDGATYPVRAGLVIGADGARSSVARAVGAGTLRASAHATANHYGFFSGIADTGTHWPFAPGRAAGVIPTNDGLHCVFVSSRPGDFDPQLDAGGFRRRFAEAAGPVADRLDGARLEGRLVGFRGMRGHLRESAGPGWALVGDAGYFKDPLTAHGITDALRDAECLVRAALFGTDQALQAYAADRDRISAELFGVTDEIASLDWTLDEIREKHIRLNRAMRDEQNWLVAQRAGVAEVA